MSTAQEFYASGRGNGFPFCPSSRDASSDDYWITLSGHKKGDVFADEDARLSSIEESRKLAMKLFWNLDVINLSTAADSFDNETGYEWDDSVTDVTIEDADGNHPIPPERVCESRPSGYKNGSSDDGFRVVNRARLEIWKLYDGVTFAGYSARPFISLPFARTSSANSLGPSTSVALYSTVPDESNLFSSSWTYEIDYVSVNGFHFICVAAVVNETSTPTIEPQNLLADADALYPDPDGDSGGSSRSEITGLDFYTYP